MDTLVLTLPSGLEAHLQSLEDNPSRLRALQEAMHTEAAKSSHKRTHFAGPWLTLIDDLMLRSLDCTLDMELFRDEFRDDYKYSLGLCGRWLRLRTKSAESRPQFTLKYRVQASSSGELDYNRMDDPKQIKTMLKARVLDVDFPCVVAWYDCLRVYLPSDGNDKNSWVDLTKFSESTYYIIATAQSPKAASSSLSELSVSQLCPRSKTLEALHHQNPKYYSRLESLDILGSHRYAGTELSHLSSCPTLFAKQFVDFQQQFVAKCPEEDDYRPMDDSDEEEYYYEQLVKMKDAPPTTDGIAGQGTRNG